MPQVEAPHDAPPVIILPGFGNNSTDYLAPFGEEELGLKAVLEVSALDTGTGITAGPTRFRIAACASAVQAAAVEPPG